MHSCSKCHTLMDTEWELMKLHLEIGFSLTDVENVEKARRSIRSLSFICSQCRFPEPNENDLDEKRLDKLADEYFSQKDEDDRLANEFVQNK
jgi:hypothetical protein